MCAIYVCKQVKKMKINIEHFGTPCILNVCEKMIMAGFESVWV